MSLLGTPLPPQSKPLEQLELAEAPFNDAQADLILQSSDEVPVHFRVFKNILSIASPIFADMFSIPTPSPPSEKPHEEVQVVPLSENSTALDIALRHIYPVKRTPKTDTLHCASILAEFSRKYQVEALHQFTIGYLRDSIEHDPVGVYSIAATYGYHDIGADSARLCLTIPFSDLQSSYMQYATAEHISELFKYHVACGRAASDLASTDRSWLADMKVIALGDSHGRCVNCGGWDCECTSTAFGGTGCRSCVVPDLINHTPPLPEASTAPNKKKRPSGKRCGPLCVWIYFHRSALVLGHHPTPEAISTEAFVLQANDCPSCAPRMRANMIDLSLVFVRQIKKAIEQVPLPKAVSIGLGIDNTTSN